MKENNSASNAAALLGSMGGRAGTGAAKRRSASHYKRLAMLGVAARLKKSKNKS